MVETSRAISMAPLFSLIGLVWLQTATGDEIVMNNGDRLTGQILHEDSDRLLLETEYAGTINIKRNQVHTLRRDPLQAGKNTAMIPGVDQSRFEKMTESRIQQATPTNPEEPSSPPTAVELPATSTITPDSELSGRVNFALSSERGNSDKNEIEIDYQVGYRRGWHRIESIGSLEFDTASDEKITDKWSTNNRYSRHFPSRWYGAAWLALKHDRFSDLRLRTLTGPALGYLAFEGEARNLGIEAGPMILHENYYDQPDREFLGPAWFLNYDQFVWQDRLQFYHRQFGYVGLNGKDKFLWQSWTGLRMPMGGGFSSSLEFEYDYDSNPAIEARKTDTALRLKLGYQW